MIRFSEASQNWRPIPDWVRFLFSFGYNWPRNHPRPRRIALVSMPCDSAAAGLISLGAMVRDLGDPRANDVDGHYDRLLHYAEQFLKFCKPCDVQCHPEVKRCGYLKQATGKLRSPLLRGTVEISDRTDFETRQLKWIQRTGLSKHCIVSRKPEHTKDYYIDGEPPCQWNSLLGELPDWQYEALFEGATVLPENRLRTYSGLCFAGRITGKSASKEVCDRIHFTDGSFTYSLRQLLAIQDWSESKTSRMAYFNARTQKLDRHVVTPTLIVADGDLAFLRACDHPDFRRCDVIGVIHRTMEYDRLEAVGIKMQPTLWLAADTDLLCELPSNPRGISIAVLKERNCL